METVRKNVVETAGKRVKNGVPLFTKPFCYVCPLILKKINIFHSLKYQMSTLSFKKKSSLFFRYQLKKYEDATSAAHTFLMQQTKKNLSVSLLLFSSYF